MQTRACSSQLAIWLVITVWQLAEDSQTRSAAGHGRRVRAAGGGGGGGGGGDDGDS